MATRKVRVKKLNVKQPLDIIKESQFGEAEYRDLTQELQVATGVEQGEENEFHLQVLLKSTGTKADNEIPVPPPQESDINYDDLYSGNYQRPNAFIRFSQTVEECIGCTYDMTENDDAFLKSYNAKRPAAQQLTEDDFEKIMEVFEETASFSTPYAAVDKTVAPYSEMVRGLNNLDSAKVMPYAKELYEYWKQQKQSSGNGPLHPSLKFETHQEKDDLDPYVCFRRREVRQTRKTRARDVQSADKLKRLRRELEDGRNLVLLSYERELQKRQLIQMDKMIFEGKAAVHDMHIRLKLKGRDNDLISLCSSNEPTKRKATETSATSKTAAAGPIRLGQPRPSGQTADMDLASLEAMYARRHEELKSDIMNKIQNHQNWNRNHVDLTKGPLSPIPGPNTQPSFRKAQAQYLLTPPASSASQESLEEPTPMDLDEDIPSAVFQFRGAAIDEREPLKVAYRRRIGRLNRMWIDRRRVEKTQSRNDYESESDRWKYDQDDSEDELPRYEVDAYDTRCIRFRATIPLTFGEARRQTGQAAIVQAQLEAQAAAAQAAAAQAAAANGQSQPQGAARLAPPA